MNIHIALYRWKPEVTPEQINQVLQEVESLATKVPVRPNQLLHNKFDRHYKSGYRTSLLFNINRKGSR